MTVIPTAALRGLMDDIAAAHAAGDTLTVRALAGIVADIWEESGTDSFTFTTWRDVATGRTWIDRITDSEIVTTSGWERSPCPPTTP